MARSASRVAGINSSVVDGELDGFFIETHSAYRYRVGLRPCRFGGAHYWVHLPRAHARCANQVGVSPALSRALAFNASDRWAFPVEFSLAAILSFDSRHLRRRSAATAAGIIRLRRGYGGQADPGHSGARSHCIDGPSDVNLASRWLLRFPAHLDISRARCDLVTFRAVAA